MYFVKFATVADIKKEYRKLCMVNHPDRGGDVEVMKVVNVEYHIALKNVHGTQSVDDNGQSHTYYYNEATEDALMEKIGALLSLQMEGVDVALVGIWIWVDGETMNYRKELKELKLRWHSGRKKWYFQTSNKRTKYKKNFSFNQMAQTYGYKQFEKDDKLSLV